MSKTIYTIGSLRNPEVPIIANELRELGFDVFDDWYAAGPEADDYWKAYEQGRGRTYGEALTGYAVNNVFSFDRVHLDRSDIVVLIMPAGKSGHLEFGYGIGSGKPGYIYLPEEPPNDRWDAMYRFATKVCVGREDLHNVLRRYLPESSGVCSTEVAAGLREWDAAHENASYTKGGERD